MALCTDRAHAFLTFTCRSACTASGSPRWQLSTYKSSLRCGIYIYARGLLAMSEHRRCTAHPARLRCRYISQFPGFFCATMVTDRGGRSCNAGHIGSHRNLKVRCAYARANRVMRGLENRYFVTVVEHRFASLTAYTKEAFGSVRPNFMNLRGSKKFSTRSDTSCEAVK